jgi:glycosyltransferase involved in cell wall biosynthesis
MRWLIIEDALSDRKGHWAAYIGTFLRGLEKQGDEAIVLCDCKAEEFITASLKAQAVLPESIWHRMGDGASALTRYLRVPVHAVRTWRAVRKYFNSHLRDQPPDVVFVPTVLPHHLLGWYLLLKSGSLPREATLLLFFPNLPLGIAADGKARWTATPTTRLMLWIFERIRPLVESKRVVLGVETAEMQSALATLTRLPVLYLPHPVDPLPDPPCPGKLPLYFAAYGVARAEKGSDIFQSAIINYLADYPESRIQFGIQWMGDFKDDHGRLVGMADELCNSERVDVIRSFFRDGEYAGWLSKTSVLVLPYRVSSYSVRVSRVVIEAMVNGLPVITTRGSTLWNQLEEFGAGVCCEDEDVRSLVLALHDMEARFPEFSKTALLRREKAREHFSVANFHRRLESFIA